MSKSMIKKVTTTLTALAVSLESFNNAGAIKLRPNIRTIKDLSPDRHIPNSFRSSSPSSSSTGPQPPSQPQSWNRTPTPTPSTRNQTRSPIRNSSNSNSSTSSSTHVWPETGGYRLGGPPPAGGSSAASGSQSTTPTPNPVPVVSANAPPRRGNASRRLSRSPGTVRNIINDLTEPAPSGPIHLNPTVNRLIGCPCPFTFINPNPIPNHYLRLALPVFTPSGPAPNETTRPEPTPVTVPETLTPEISEPGLNPVMNPVPVMPMETTASEQADIDEAIQASLRETETRNPSNASTIDDDEVQLERAIQARLRETETRILSRYSTYNISKEEALRVASERSLKPTAHDRIISGENYTRAQPSSTPVREVQTDLSTVEPVVVTEPNVTTATDSTESVNDPDLVRAIRESYSTLTEEEKNLAEAIRRSLGN